MKDCKSDPVVWLVIGVAVGVGVAASARPGISTRTGESIGAQAERPVSPGITLPIGRMSPDLPGDANNSGASGHR